jgi:hypothetical protein
VSLLCHGYVWHSLYDAATLWCWLCILGWDGRSVCLCGWSGVMGAFACWVEWSKPQTGALWQAGVPIVTTAWTQGGWWESRAWLEQAYASSQGL